MVLRYISQQFLAAILEIISVVEIFEGFFLTQ